MFFLWLGQKQIEYKILFLVFVLWEKGRFLQILSNKKHIFRLLQFFENLNFTARMLQAGPDLQIFLLLDPDFEASVWIVENCI